MEHGADRRRACTRRISPSSSGTRLAIEDAIALVKALESDAHLSTAAAPLSAPSESRWCKKLVHGRAH